MNKDRSIVSRALMHFRRRAWVSLGCDGDGERDLSIGVVEHWGIGAAAGAIPALDTAHAVELDIASGGTVV